MEFFFLRRRLLQGLGQGALRYTVTGSRPHRESRGRRTGTRGGNRSRCSFPRRYHEGPGVPPRPRRTAAHVPELSLKRRSGALEKAMAADGARPGTARPSRRSKGPTATGARPGEPITSSRSEAGSASQRRWHRARAPPLRRDAGGWEEGDGRAVRMRGAG